MPENWSLPTTTSNYATGVIQAINNKFIDTITLFRGGVGSNIPVNSIRYNGDLDGTFQRFNGSVWNDMILGVTGGGTGSNNPTGIRTNLGLGTMSTQNSNAVAITGGTFTGSTNIQSSYINGSRIDTADGQYIYNINGANIALGIINPARLANGTPNSTVFLRGDSTWAAPAGTLPSGMIAIFTVGCPAGWTRLASWDGRFLRAMPTYGATGGSNTHSHDGSGFTVASHSHAVGTLAVAAHTHPAGTLNTPSHTHTMGAVSISVSISGTTSSSGGHDHGFSFTTGAESNGQMNCDAGSSGSMARAPHSHSGSGTTASEPNHSHTFSGSGSGSGTPTISTQASQGINGATGSTTPGITGTTGAQTAGISGTTNAVDHYPYFIDVVYCQKD